jgi:RimJ/RimL family protein N-acetyltransferase
VIPTPDLRADGLSWAAFAPSDAAELASLVADDPVIKRFAMSLRGVREEADALAWLAKRQVPGRVEWAVRQDGKLVGRVALHDISAEGGFAEIGYGVFAPFRGRGLGTRLARTATSYGFDELGLERIMLRHATANLASCAVAHSCGYAFEGVMRHGLLDENNAHEDAHLHARLRGDPGTPIERQPPVEVTEAGLTLKPWTEADAEFMLGAMEDPAIRRWNPIKFDGRPIADLAEARTVAGRFSDWTGGGGSPHCSWVLMVDGQRLGHVSLYHVDHESSSAGIGYWLLPSARGQGLAARAVDVAARWAYGTLGLRRVELFHALDNPASCAVARRAGFLVEGQPRATYRYGDGELHDEHMHGRLAEDPTPTFG